MNITRFALGIRFDTVGLPVDDVMERSIFNEIFSVLTVSQLKGLRIYGGDYYDRFGSKPGVYMVVLMGGSLKEMRRIYEKLRDDAGVSMYLTHNRPFIENNALAHVEGLKYFGTVNGNGTITGGDEALILTVPKLHGKKRAVGKRIKILLAPESYGGFLTSYEAIKRLTIAARRHFPGVKVIPVCVTDGGNGMLEAIISAGKGVYRYASVKNAYYEKTRARYGVLFGTLAVIEAGEAAGLKDGKQCAGPSTYGVGELIRRALDEGIKRIIIGLSDDIAQDGGIGFARALGARFYSADGDEIIETGGMLDKISRADMERLHPGVKESQFIFVYNGKDSRLHGSEARLAEIIASASGREDILSAAGAGVCSGMGAALIAVLNAAPKPALTASLEAVNIEKLIAGSALIVTGGDCAVSLGVSPGIIPTLIAYGKARRIPVAVLMGDSKEAYIDSDSFGQAAVIALERYGDTVNDSGKGYIARFDKAADRLFRLIRIGRDVERISSVKLKMRKRKE